MCNWKQWSSSVEGREDLFIAERSIIKGSIRRLYQAIDLNKILQGFKMPSGLQLKCLPVFICIGRTSYILRYISFAGCHLFDTLCTHCRIVYVYTENSFNDASVKSELVTRTAYLHEILYKDLNVYEPVPELIQRVHYYYYFFNIIILKIKRRGTFFNMGTNLMLI